MTQLKKLAKRGFTLIELMIVVVIIGVLAAMALYGVQKYVTNAKTAEARTFLGRMAKDAVIVFQGENMEGSVITLTGTRASSNRLCGSSTFVPAASTSIQGKKYQPSPTEFQTGSQTVGWECLKFSVNDPTYFQVGFVANPAGGGAAADGNTFTALAYGDLDSDTVLSTFSLLGQVQTAGNTLVLTPAPSITESNPSE